MLKINNRHLLEDVPFHASHDVNGEITPTLLLIHFTAGGHARGSIEWLSKEDDSFLSAHCVVARDGSITQLVPFNLGASHAGVSEWKGRKWCNAYSIGVEIANWGLLKQVPGDPVYLRSWTGRAQVPYADAMHATHKYGRPEGWWEKFPTAQYRAVVALGRALFAHYESLRDIAGHDDVAPGRKIDPGPAWPMAQYRRDVTQQENPPLDDTDVICVSKARLLEVLTSGVNELEKEYR